MSPLLSARIKHLLGRVNLHIRRRIYAPRSEDRFLYNDLLQFTQKQHLPQLIFDVGANIGQTVAAFHYSLPEFSVHAFEPFQATQQLLQQNIGHLPKVRCWPLALGSASGIVHVPNQSIVPASTLNHLQEASPTALADSETITVTTIDAFCKEQKIPFIGLLKIDTEGHDLEVLKGASHMLSTGAIGAVLIECSIAPLSSRHTPLQTIQDHLRPQDFEFFSLCDATALPPHGRHWYCNALFKHTSILKESI